MSPHWRDLQAPGLTLVTSPAVEPLTPLQVKDQLRVETGTDDVFIDGLIAAARQHLDGRDGGLNRALITQTWELRLDEFPIHDPLGAIRLPYPPLQSVTSVKYLDLAGVEQTVPAADYVVDTQSRVGRVVLAPDTSWPETRDTIHAVRIQYVAGYGDAGTDVPAPIRQAMLLLIGHWYEHREEVVPGAMTRLPVAAEALLAPFVVMGVP